MQSPRLLTVILMFCLPFSARGEDKATIQLGGPRKVQGEVVSSPTHYTVSVSLLSVKAFDAETNEEINVELARENAVRVLARHLSKTDDTYLSIRGEELVKSRVSGDRYAAIVRWPKDGVKVLVKGETPTETARIVLSGRFRNKFFTARQDHLDTLKALEDGLAIQIKQLCEKAAASDGGERRKVLARGIARTEERGLAAFDQLAKEVGVDVNLTDLAERPELKEAIAKARSIFLERLRTAYGEAGGKKLPFKDIKIEKPFAEFLANNPLLMDLAGAIIVDLGRDGRLLIGVGKVVLKDGSPQDLLRAERVATLKARTAVIGERDGVKISYLKRVEDLIIIVKDEEGEKAISVSERLKVTQEKIEGIAKNLPVVGSWKSEDGRIFYIAVGGKAPTSK